ncbi:FMN-linked oxidoreductase [Guyanagaster necrorhizus]|uniref:FMN-linked oxidoreductase n=1 Tax=Guyanagaster necrorhizus TaxID=856835 RepID=A0A9P8ASQ6_9AGAR|nr:FMN-linked oxidoreductase [Guyanagaster necrorhizus MCA 3950]KAG7446584.1 FMN-linked oxidoreductase [Guyanagaster necrorhizus MCA 3950]
MSSKLFHSTQVGAVSLEHRVVLAPMTRLKATESHVPHIPLVRVYYEQRSHTPGTLLITEATVIAAKAGGIAHTPGIWSQEQIGAWRQITDGVHAKGSFIFCQLWALGRAADPKVLVGEDPTFPYISASDIPVPGRSDVPRPMRVDEIKEYIELHVQAALNAVAAGFDGVEIHGANGYLLDQFIQDVTNQRTDAYGGGIENRARFPLEIVDGVVKAIGAERTGYRASPWSYIEGMGMKDPKPTFAYLVSEIKARHPNFAYIHVIEPRVNGTRLRREGELTSRMKNDFIRDIWAPLPLISAGGYERVTAITTADEKNDIIAFGKHFLANPDLVYRLKKDIPLNAYDRSTFYVPGNVAKGYTDYTFAGEAPKSPL